MTEKQTQYHLSKLNDIYDLLLKIERPDLADALIEAIEYEGSDTYFCSKCQCLRDCDWHEAGGETGYVCSHCYDDMQGADCEKD